MENRAEITAGTTTSSPNVNAKTELEQRFPEFNNFLTKYSITQCQPVSSKEGYLGVQQKGMYIFSTSGSLQYFGKVILNNSQYELENEHYKDLKEKVSKNSKLEEILTLPLEEIKDAQNSSILQIMPFAGSMTLDQFIRAEIRSFEADKQELFFKILHNVGHSFGLLHQYRIIPIDHNLPCNSESFRLRQEHKFSFVDCGWFTVTDPEFEPDLLLANSHFPHLFFANDSFIFSNHVLTMIKTQLDTKKADVRTIIERIKTADDRMQSLSIALENLTPNLASWRPWLARIIEGFMSASAISPLYIQQRLQIQRYKVRVKINKYDPHHEDNNSSLFATALKDVFLDQSLQETFSFLEKLLG